MSKSANKPVKTVEQRLKTLESRYNTFTKLVVERLEKIEAERDGWAWVCAFLVKTIEASDHDPVDLALRNLQTVRDRLPDPEAPEWVPLALTQATLAATCAAVPPYP